VLEPIFGQGPFFGVVDFGVADFGVEVVPAADSVAAGLVAVDVLLFALGAAAAPVMPAAAPAVTSAPAASAAPSSLGICIG
jgi:hypothetical protein